MLYKGVLCKLWSFQVFIMSCEAFAANRPLTVRQPRPFSQHQIEIYGTTYGRCKCTSRSIGVGTRGARGAIAPPLFQKQGKIYC